MLWSFYLWIMGSQKPNNEGNTDQSCDHISRRLCDLHTSETQKGNSEQKHRNCNSTGTDHGKNRRNCRLLDTLIEHIYRNRERHKHHTEGGKTQCNGADPNHIFLFLENGNNLFGKENADQGHNADKYQTERSGKQESFFNAVIFFCPVVEGCNGLETLVQTYVQTKIYISLRLVGSLKN